ncbi:hypothetical protein EJD97_021944 [Solanum chilense]|uniref:MADS-box domain-containing protein n=1 Tax=Solanum chilense TaxID=4083 RepID=A0A6N2CBW9_SOLCI|nr:hypothetical protein EJD97_021944 [Solanum chilense]
MGHNKIVMKKIEDPTSRKQFYSNRKDNIVKKSNELAVVCGTDVALLMFSRAGQETTYSSKESVEDITIEAMKKSVNPRYYNPQVENIIYVQEVESYEQFLRSNMEQIQQSKAKLLGVQGFVQRNEYPAVSTVDTTAPGNESSYLNDYWLLF